MTKKILCITLIVIVTIICFSQPVLAEDVQIHGFVSQGYMKSSQNNYLVESDRGSYQFNEMGLNFMYDSGTNISAGAQLAARDLGDVGNDKVEVNWAFGDLRWREWLGFRAGIMKMPMGLYNENRDIDSLRTWILLPQSLYDEWMRDAAQGVTGISLYGNIGLGAAGMLTYDLKMADLTVPTDGGMAQFIINSSQFITSVDRFSYKDFYFGALKWYTPVEGLLMGVSGLSVDGHHVVNGSAYYYDLTDYTWLVYSIEYILGDLVLAGEYSTSESDVRLYPIGSTPGAYTHNEDAGYYISASYRFLSWLELGVYYSNTDKIEDLDTPETELEDWCLASRFDISHDMTFKLEYHKMEGLYGVDAGDDGTFDESWDLFAAKVSWNF